MFAIVTLPDAQTTYNTLSTSSDATFQAFLPLMITLSGVLIGGMLIHFVIVNFEDIMVTLRIPFFVRRAGMRRMLDMADDADQAYRDEYEMEIIRQSAHRARRQASLDYFADYGYMTTPFAYDEVKSGRGRKAFLKS